MVEKTLIEKYKTGIIGLILLLAGFGGASVLTEDQIEHAYVCTSNEKLAICTGTPTHPEPLSGTGASCYFTNEEPRDTYSRCSNGYFMPLVEYAELKGVDPISFLQQEINVPETPESVQKPSGKQQRCTPEGCVDID